MPSLLHFQIIIDILFFVVIMLLLRQLNKRMAKNQAGGDGAPVRELEKLMAESRDSTDLFLRAVQESEERFNKLARHLDNREKRIVILLEKADSLIQKMDSRMARAEPVGADGETADGETYEQIIRMVQEGRPREEVAKRLGIAMGEIDLVVELEQARLGRS